MCSVLLDSQDSLSLWVSGFSHLCLSGLPMPALVCSFNETVSLHLSTQDVLVAYPGFGRKRGRRVWCNPEKHLGSTGKVKAEHALILYWCFFCPTFIFSILLLSPSLSLLLSSSFSFNHFLPLSFSALNFNLTSFFQPSLR